jgi:hypothetical protein
MTVEIRRTGASDYGRYTKALICGEPGAGKTLISSTWPNPLYASAEGGLMSIADRNIPYVEIRSLDDLLRIKNSLDQPEDVREQIFGFKVETVVIDTIDEVQQIMVRERLRDERIAGMRLADWNWLSEQMGALIRGFRNLDMHVVFTCHLKETSDSDTGKTWVKPGLQGSMADKIAAYVDLALLLKNGLRTEVVEGEAKRVMSRELQTFPDPLHPWIKDRSGKLPQDLDVNFADDFERIEELIFGSVDLKEGAVSEMHELAEPEDAIAPAVEAVPEPVAAPEPVKVADPVLKADPPEQVVVAAEADAEPSASGPRNQLPDGVEPKDLGHGVNIYCTVCGDEVASEEDADLSRIRHRRIMCKPCFKGVAK